MKVSVSPHQDFRTWHAGCCSSVLIVLAAAPKKVIRTMIMLLLLFLFNFLDANSAQAMNSQQEIITKDDDVHKYMQYLWCPSKLLGMMCPENSITYYYYCCGDLRNKCCYATRTWVMVVSLLVPMLILTAIVVYLLRKFVFTKRDRYIAGQRQS